MIIQKRSAKIKLPCETASQDTPIFYVMTQFTSYQWFKHMVNDFICSLLRWEDWVGELIQRYPNFILFLDNMEKTYIRGGFPIEMWNVHDRPMSLRSNKKVESEWKYRCWHIIETQKVWPHLSTANSLMLRPFNLNILLDWKVSLGSHFVVLLAINQTISGKIIRISTIE